ncbi:rCG25501 [Rattus norvegicus]|uniref:RCG25501 n=1 Tax=Rattus norvegicus TaxID=10116 RepID=A6I2N0_RAT|nr:rCG25501 [Rattus norvegicus]
MAAHICICNASCISILMNLMPPSGFCWHQTCMHSVHRYTRRQNTHIK